MAHKVMDGGTTCEIAGGRLMDAGSVYEVSKGKFMDGGTVYEIPFAKEMFTVTLKKENAADDSNPLLTGWNKYSVVINGQTYDWWASGYPIALTLEDGTVIDCRTQAFSATMAANCGVFLNGKKVSTNNGNVDDYAYTVKCNATITLYYQYYSWSGENPVLRIKITEQ